MITYLSNKSKKIYTNNQVVITNSLYKFKTNLILRNLLIELFLFKLKYRNLKILLLINNIKIN